jgi:hypothetical protein
MRKVSQMEEKINKKLSYSGYGRLMDAGYHYGTQGFKFLGYCLIPLQLSLAYVNQLQESAAIKVYH